MPGRPDLARGGDDRPVVLGDRRTARSASRAGWPGCPDGSLSREPDAARRRDRPRGRVRPRPAHPTAARTAASRGARARRRPRRRSGRRPAPRRRSSRCRHRAPSPRRAAMSAADAPPSTRSLLTATASPALAPSAPRPTTATIPEPERVAGRDRERAQVVGRQAVAPDHHDAVDRAGRQRRRLRARLLRPLRGQLVLQRLHLLEQPLDPIGELGGRDLERVGEVAQLRPPRRGCGRARPPR